MLRLLDCFDDILIEPFMPNGSSIAFDISILLRLARLDMLDRDVAALGPFQKLVTDVFRAVVDPNACWLAAPFDDLVQAPDDALCWEREVDIDCQAFAIEVIENVEKPESSPIAKPVSHKIHRPAFVWRFRNRKFIRLFPHQTLARLDAQIQLKFPIDPVNSLVVPQMPFDVAKVQKTQAEAPCLMRFRQAY